MRRSDAIDLKAQLTDELRLLGHTLSKAPDEHPLGAPLPIGLGICGGARDEWLVAVRVYEVDWTKETRNAVADIRRRCRGEVDVKLAGQPVFHAARPLASGHVVGSTNELWGTLGWFVQLEDEDGDRVYGLTCAHAVAREGQSSCDDLIVRPPPPDAEMPTPEIVGTIARVAPLPAPWLHQRVDAALIALNDGVEAELAVGSRGPVREVLVPSGEETVVTKTGGATSVTLGALTAQKLTVPFLDPRTGVSVVFADQYEIEAANPGEPFSAPGDSGALVIEPRSHSGIGLLLGGLDDRSYATPLNTVLTALNASPA